MRPVLVDTSAWIDLLRRGDSPEAATLVELIGKGLARTTGLVQAELLSGAASEKEFAELKDYLSAFDSLDDPPELWPRVGELRFRLARKGFQVAIADLVVAATAHHHGAELFTKDAQFEAIAKVLPLKLVRAAPH